jgi:hypothetical protein
VIAPSSSTTTTTATTTTTTRARSASTSKPPVGSSDQLPSSSAVGNNNNNNNKPDPLKPLTTAGRTSSSDKESKWANIQKELEHLLGPSGSQFGAAVPPIASAKGTGAPASKRDEIAAEILSSEQKYVQSLDLLVNLWYKPMQQMPDNVVSRQNIKSIFSILETIHNYNSWFLTKIEERISRWDNNQKLGDIFLELV